MTDVQIFKNTDFGEIRTFQQGNTILFCGNDVAKSLGYSDCPKAVRTHCKGVAEISTPTKGGVQAMKFIPEGDVYRLIISSKLPTAEKFEKWVFDEVLPTIRKTGGYVNNDDMFINTYLPFADDTVKLLFKQTLNVVRHQNEIIAEKDKTINLQNKEIIYKEDVIFGLTDDIDLATKRQRITQIIRHNARNNFQERYALLYSEFEKKYHCNLKRRMASDEAQAIKPKIKNKMDYIDRGMSKIPQLYEICCKLFESDVKQLMKIWEDTI